MHGLNHKKKSTQKTKPKLQENKNPTTLPLDTSIISTKKEKKIKRKEKKKKGDCCFPKLPHVDFIYKGTYLSTLMQNRQTSGETFWSYLDKIPSKN